MLNRIVAAAGLVFAASIITPAAASVTYDVNLTVGDGSVFGSITTDGTFGTLSSGNITGFSLTLNGVGASTMIMSSSTTMARIVGDDVTASSSALSFNFSGSDNGYLLFQQNLFSGSQYFCSATVYDTCFQGESVVPESYNSPSAVVVPLLGEHVIGTVTGVPLPASLPLFGAGLLGLAGFGYRARRKALAARH